MIPLRVCKDVLKSIVRIASREGLAIPLSMLSEHLRIPEQVLREYLSFLEEEDLVELRDDLLFLKVPRIELACAAISLGADVEEVAEALDWREFEELTARCLSENGFEVYEHFIFRGNKRRYEVDILGIREPIILLVDCKHWRAGRSKRWRLRRAAEDHLRRTEALVDALPRTPLYRRVCGWSEIVVTPILVTLHQELVILHNQIPLVPVYKLNSFLQDLQGWLDSIYSRKIRPRLLL